MSTAGKGPKSEVSRSTISIYALMKMLPDAESARVYLEARKWPNGPFCPDCKSERVARRKRPGFYHCNSCKLDFTVLTGTGFERSKVRA